MNVRLASPLTYDSIVDGPGLRIVIWTQGCYHNCKGCHNPETHDIKKGYDAPIEEIIKDIKNSKLHRGITISGGEPFLQSEKLTKIAKEVKNNDMDIWIYTGYMYEQLLNVEDAFRLLLYTDVLVDGKFDISKKDGLLRFKGSTNQRIIDVKQSLKLGKTIILDI